MVRLELTDAMVLAAARVSEPRLFAHGLAPLLRDGPNTRKRMADEESRVRRMLDAAFGLATQTAIDEGARMTGKESPPGERELPGALVLAKSLRAMDVGHDRARSYSTDSMPTSATPSNSDPDQETNGGDGNDRPRRRS